VLTKTEVDQIFKVMVWDRNKHVTRLNLFVGIQPLSSLYINSTITVNSMSIHDNTNHFYSKHLNSQYILTKTEIDQIFKVMVWDRHKCVTRLNQFFGIQQFASCYKFY
jgi:hypothetical protein